METMQSPSLKAVQTHAETNAGNRHVNLQQELNY